jgi:hypothetical protein
MGSFRKALLGYRRPDVDAALLEREAQIAGLEGELGVLSEMVIEREREIRGLNEGLREVGARHDRALATLETITGRIDEIHAQARAQATRIRMKALREAVEVTRRAEEMSAQLDARAVEVLDAAIGNENGRAEIPAADLFEGLVRVDVGPLGDFSQLVGFEEALGRIGATSEISVERFSGGRATLALRLEEPVALLRELETRSPLGFEVRRNGGGTIVLDVEDTAPQQRAA